MSKYWWFCPILGMTASNAEEPLKAKVVKVGEEMEEKVGKEWYIFGFTNNCQLLWCLDLITRVGKFMWKILWVYWQDVKGRLNLWGISMKYLRSSPSLGLEIQLCLLLFLLLLKKILLIVDIFQIKILNPQHPKKKFHKGTF